LFRFQDFSGYLRASQDFRASQDISVLLRISGLLGTSF
jgi:hypothetical protein